MSDELEKNAPPVTEEEGDEDVEAHKAGVGKAGVGAADDENDVEAHKYGVGKTSVGKTSIG